jgi:hypothetical protein
LDLGKFCDGYEKDSEKIIKNVGKLMREYPRRGIFPAGAGLEESIARS